jgi:hypothetical protein
VWCSRTKVIAVQTASVCKLQHHFIVTPSQPRGPAPLNAITKLDTQQKLQNTLFDIDPLVKDMPSTAT